MMQMVFFETPCGCLVSKNTVTSEYHLSYCPTHAAAPELLEAAKAIDEAFVTVETIQDQEALALIVAAIALAKLVEEEKENNDTGNWRGLPIR